MGARLTKRKDVSTSEKTNEQQKEIDLSAENEENKQKPKKDKKKNEQKFNKRSAETRVDKSTNTESCVLPPSPLIEQSVDEPISTINNNVSLDTSPAQVNAAYQPETPNQDVQELRDAIQNGFLSAEINVGNEYSFNEQEYQTNNTSATVVAKRDSVNSNEQQQQQQLLES
jgi:hypothetical protein